MSAWSTPRLRDDEKPSRARLWPLAAGLLLAAGAAAWALRSLDLAAAPRLLSARGAWLGLALLPYLAALGFDTLAWRSLLRACGRRLAFLDLLRIRLGAEALGLLLPSAGLVQELVALRALSERHRVPVAASLASLVTRRFLLVQAHGLVLGLAALLLFAFLGGRPGARLLPWIVALAAPTLFGFGKLGPRFFGAASFGQRAARALRRLPSRSLRLWTARHRREFARADQAVARLALRSGLDARLPLLGFVCALGAEAMESLVILRLLGSDIGLLPVLAFEPVVSLLRSLLTVAPGGLGIQEAGYAVLLLAVPHENAAGLAAAFVVLKRLKDGVFFVLGLLALGLARPASFRAAPDETARAGPLRLRLAEPDHPDA